MKKADIKVGESYATSHSQEWRNNPNSVTKVTVIGEPTTVKTTGRYYGTNKTSTEVPVKDDQGREYKVKTRLFREPWATFAEFKVAHDKAVLENAQHVARQRLLRAKLALRLIDALEEAGLPLETSAVYYAAEAQWLAGHGFLLYNDERFGDGTANLVAPLADAGLAGYINKGTPLTIKPQTLLDLIATATEQR